MALTGCTSHRRHQCRSIIDATLSKNGRGERIRTSGPCLPKTVLYQAELLPDRNPTGREVAAGAKARA